MTNNSENEASLQLAGNDEILIYQSQDGTIKVDVLFENETVWLSQNQLCVLFGKSKSTISEHIKHIFEEGELDEKVVVRKFRTTTLHGAIDDKTQSHGSKINIGGCGANLAPDGNGKSW